MSKEEIIEGNKAMVADFEFPAGYAVSKEGKVRGRYGRTLKLHAGTSGYIQVNTNVRGKKKTFLLHRLVAAKYLPNPKGLPEVNHKDGNKLNNHVDNLEWVSRKDNIRHGFDNNLITPGWQGKSGAKHIRSKAIQQLDSAGKPITTYGSIREAGRVTGINSNSINDVLTGRNKTAGGYNWKYLSSPTTIKTSNK